MNEREIRGWVVRILVDIAPEVDPLKLKGDLNLREELDLDSFDTLRFFVRLGKELKVEFPDPDIPKLTSIDSIVAYVAGKLSIPGQ